MSTTPMPVQSRHLIRSRSAAAVRAAVLLLIAAAGCEAQQPKQPKEDIPQPAVPSIPVVQPTTLRPDPMFKQFEAHSKLPMIQRSVLNNVDGKINHIALDAATSRLYVAAKNQNTVEILAINGSAQLKPIADVPEPSGVLVIPDLRKLVVTCAGDNTARTYDISKATGNVALGDPNGVIAEKTVKFEGEVDQLRFDNAAKRVYVVHGKKLGSFNLDTGERGPSLELPATPEGFAIDPMSDHIFVNIPSTGSVAFLTRSKDTGELKLEKTVALKEAKGNYAAAYDPASGHFFAVCRNPAKLVVLDTKSGEQAAAVDCIDDADDAWWDPLAKRVYISGGGSGGRVDMIDQGAPAEKGKPATYTVYSKETTNVGARTSILVPEIRRFVVAAPKIGGDPMFLYIYVIGP